MIKKNLNIAFIGAGKIAHSLAPALKGNGYNIIQVISRNIDSAKVLAKEIDVNFFSNDLNDISPDANLVFLSVPDGIIKPVADYLSGLKLNFTGKTFIHLSGSKSILDLKPLADMGSRTGSLHIMQTFPARKSVSILNCYAAVEPDSDVVKQDLFDLSSNSGMIPFEISTENKVMYHLTGVYVSNFLVGNFLAAEKIAEKMKDDIPPVKKYTMPTFEKTLDNIRKLKTPEALSGPVERGDLDTVKLHVKELWNDKLLCLNYISMSLLLNRAALNKSSVDEPVFEKMNSFLYKCLKELRPGSDTE